jgi:hypothetical protein
MYVPHLPKEIYRPRQKMLVSAAYLRNRTYLKTLVESMPRRLQDVIDKEGATTKY